MGRIGIACWDGLTGWDSKFGLRLFRTGVFSKSLILFSLLHPAAGARDQVEEPQDSDDLRLSHEAESFRDWAKRHDVSTIDSLLYDVRQQYDYSFEEDVTRSILGDSAFSVSEQYPMPTSRNMFAEHRELPQSDILVRSIVTRRWGSGPTEPDMKERNLLRWDSRDQEGRGSYAEMTLSTSAAAPQLTGMTLHHLSEDGSGEFIIGGLSDRTSNGIIFGDKDVRMRTIGRGQIGFTSGRSFSKPSFLSEMMTVTGLGGRYDLARETSVVGFIGKSGTTRGEAWIGKIVFMGRIGDRLTVGTGIVRRERGQISPTLVSDIVIEGVRTHVESTREKEGNISSLLQSTSQVIKSLKMTFAVWHKSIALPALGSDGGSAFGVRWSLMKNHSIEMSRAVGQIRISDGPSLARSFLEISARGVLIPSFRWSLTVREGKEEQYDQEQIGDTRRRDLFLSVKAHVSRRVRFSFRVRRIGENGEQSVRSSSWMECGVQQIFERYRIAYWGGIYHAATGLSIWTTHPGYSLWPVAVIYSGSGYHYGVSTLIFLFPTIRVAGYYSQTVKDEGTRVHAGILLEFHQ